MRPMSERVVVAGDWHGDTTAGRLVIDRAAELGIHTILHVGDLGVGPWPGETKTTQGILGRHLDKRGSVLLLTPGNHENWDRIDAARVDDDGRSVLANRVLSLPRGDRWTIAGRTFGSLGGAVSVDTYRRTPGRTWWPQELVTEAHVDALGNDPLDVLITHDVPAGVPVVVHGEWPSDLVAASDHVRDLLAAAVTRTRPELVFCGHWHHRVTHPLSERTTVHVLSEEHSHGNSVVLDLDTMTVEPLQQVWMREAR